MRMIQFPLQILAGLGLWSAAQAQVIYPSTIDTLPKQATSGPVPFRKLKIQNEGTIESCAFGDFNGDKITDIVSGNHWFAGPSFQAKTRFRLLSTADRTTPDDMTVSLDVDGDGYDEVISGGHNMGLFCYRNPGKTPGAAWTREVIDAERPPDGFVDTSIAAGLPHTLGWHSGGLVDVDGDGKAEELLTTGVRADAKLTMRWYQAENGKWKKYDLGVKCEQWGSGVGDLNGDGRADIICPDAWLEAPANRRTGTWIKHPFASDICNVKGEPEPKFTNALGAVSGHATQIYAYDVDRDGLNDILLSSGHGNGIFWYRQTRSPGGTMAFQERIIDSSWHQSHNLEFKDMNRDGHPDLVSGKRWGGWGPDEHGANCIFWYQLTPGAANPWTRHTISFNEKSGMGTKGDIRDIDGDGDMDLVGTSFDAQGTVLYINDMRPVAPARRISLFNGKNLDGWIGQGQGSWTVVAGEIRGSKSPDQTDWGHLVSQAEFGDCYVRVKYKVDSGNGGTYVRSAVGGNFGVTGIQVEMGGNDGSMMTVTRDEWKWMIGNPAPNPQAPLGQWHELGIEVKGQDLASFVNGQAFKQAGSIDTSLLPRKGRLAFQLHAGGDRIALSIKSIEVFIPTLIRGCMDSRYREYNPQANDTDAAACKSLTTGLMGFPGINAGTEAGKGPARPWGRWFPFQEGAFDARGRETGR